MCILLHVFMTQHSVSPIHPCCVGFWSPQKPSRVNILGRSPAPMCHGVKLLGWTGQGTYSARCRSGRRPLDGRLGVQGGAGGALCQVQPL